MKHENSNEMSVAPADALVLTVAEMCAAFRVSKNRVFNEMKAGRLPAKRLGGRVLISRDDANAWWKSLPNRKAA